MSNNPLKVNPVSSPAPVMTTSKTTGQLRQEYEAQRALLGAQPALVLRFLEGQARGIAEALDEHLPQVRFQLPDRVVDLVQEAGLKTPAAEMPAVNSPGTKTLSVPADYREQLAGGLMDRITRTDLRAALRARLLELEQPGKEAVSVASRLIRHATVLHMVYNMLPSGRSVQYKTAEGEEIPTIPVSDTMEPESAITAATDAIAEESQAEAGRGELLVPFVPYARQFYLPQWIAFDNEGKLISRSVSEAEAAVASMQRFLSILHTAVYLAHYMVADEEYQRKRYGMLGQLINQGRALAIYESQEIIRTIKRRAATNDLNRGLSLSLPYFDDQELAMKLYDFEVIPAGRIMFVPAFVVRAANQEQAMVAQDTRLSPSTRKHLMLELSLLEHAFDTRQKP
jgi:hypothetical protein